MAYFSTASDSAGKVFKLLVSTDGINWQEHSLSSEVTKKCKTPN